MCAFDYSVMYMTAGFVAWFLYSRQDILSQIEGSHWFVHMEIICILFAAGGSGINLMAMTMALFVVNDSMHIEPP